ncbi:MAG TPA: hypothetical protein VNI84_20475 [Pyrinomonadaceae bacterium]|nr:hypothetical protein [Pyrinomonadaceae bacterium]
MPNLQEIIARAEQLGVGTANDAFQSIVADAGFTYETLFPHVLRFTIKRMLTTGRAGVQELEQTVSISVTDGIGTLNDNVIKECLDDAKLLNYPISSRLPFSDYARGVRFDSMMAYFSFLGNQVYFTDGGEILFTGNIFLVVPVIPQLPAVITQPIPLTAKTAEAVIATLAAVMRGEIPLMELVSR